MSKQELLAPEKTNGDLTVTPMLLIEKAMAQGLDADKLGKLMELQFAWERNEARKAYIAAIQAFKANPPEINKTHEVNYPNKDGSRTIYHHAELAKINKIIGDGLKQVGITSSWRTSDVNGRITVTCVLTHELGHSEDVATLSGPADTSGGKNNVQAIGSTTTYLQRYTLLSGLGLSAEGADDDGKSAEGLPQQTVADYLTTIKDASSLDDLQKAFAAAYKAAKPISDANAMRQFTDAKEQRKKELAR